MLVAVSIVFFLVAAIFLWRSRGRWLLNPVPLAVAGQVLMFAGSIPLMDASIEADRVHALIMLWALVTFIAGATIADMVFPQRHRAAWFAEPTRIDESVTFQWVARTLVAVSLGVTLAYYLAVGANIFIQSALSYLSTGQGLENAIVLREEFYAGETYFAPGYVNQFKNILLPLFTVYYVLRASLEKRPLDRLIAIVLVPASIVALLGTGQRGAFADAVVMAMFFGAAALPKRLARRYAIVLMTGGLLLFGTATLFLGRSLRGPNSGSRSTVAAVALEVWQRAVWGNQASSVVGFRYVYDRPTVWGSDWFYSVTALVPRNIFPNKKVPTLQIDIFEVLYNSRGGTAAASLWGSTWYNFGPLGVLIFPFLLGVIYQRIHARAIAGPKLLSRIGVYTGITIVMGLWLVSGPETLFNRGLVALLVLAFLIRLRVYAPRPAPRAPSGGAPLATATNS